MVAAGVVVRGEVVRGSVGGGLVEAGFARSMGDGLLQRIQQERRSYSGTLGRQHCSKEPNQPLKVQD